MVTTAPTVVYKCVTTDGQELTINSPADLPDATKRENISEPYVLLEMVTPKVGAWGQQRWVVWCGVLVWCHAARTCSIGRVMVAPAHCHLAWRCAAGAFAQCPALPAQDQVWMIVSSTQQRES